MPPVLGDSTVERWWEGGMWIIYCDTFVEYEAAEKKKKKNIIYKSAPDPVFVCVRVCERFDGC